MCGCVNKWMCKWIPLRLRGVLASRLPPLPDRLLTGGWLFSACWEILLLSENKAKKLHVRFSTPRQKLRRIEHWPQQKEIWFLSNLVPTKSTNIFNFPSPKCTFEDWVVTVTIMQHNVTVIFHPQFGALIVSWWVPAAVTASLPATFSEFFF